MNPIDLVIFVWLPWMIDASWQLALLVVIVAAICVLARRASPRLRHALWMLVLIKALLPPSLATPISVGHWAIAPLLEAGDMMPTVLVRKFAIDTSEFDRLGTPEWHADFDRDVPAPPATRPMQLTAYLPVLIVWLLGCLAFWAIVAGRYRAVCRLIGGARRLDEGPARIALERIGLDLKLGWLPELLASPQVGTPFLFGVLRPRIVVPETLLLPGSETVLEAVLAHELAHFKRHDAWIGWLQVVAQSLFWFHPFLWFANRQLRHERECASDETVLRLSQISPQRYGEAILNLLIESRGRALVAGSLVGVFEPGGKLERRLQEIMRFEPTGRQFQWLARVALLAFAILFLPMDPGQHVIQVAVGEPLPKDLQVKAADFPQIVKMNPDRGDTDVDPAVQREISVTFDRDMSKGMSWTGAPPLFPEIDGDLPIRWLDQRTCVLPVKLKKGTYYRLGINATGFHNFQSVAGLPVPPAVIAFVTRGASDEVQQRVKVPKIVSLTPDDGMKDVDPETKTLRVTFNMPMGEGMSWTGGGASMPKTPDEQGPSWSKDRKTCTLPVLLEPGLDYRLGLNDLAHNNFQSAWGIPLEPVEYRFHTRDAAK